MTITRRSIATQHQADHYDYYMVSRDKASRNLENLDLFRWWQNETEDFGTFVLRLLASLPGGELAEDMGYEPFADRRQMRMVTQMLRKIRTEDDVAYMVEWLTHDPETDEEA